MDIIKRLLKLTMPYKFQVLLSLLLHLITIVTRLVMPYLTKSVVNDVIIGGQVNLIAMLSLMILLLVVIRASTSYIRNVIMERMSQDVAYDLRTGLYNHLQCMPFEFYDKNRIGEIMSRMTGDLEGMRDFLSNGIITVYDNFLCFFGSLIFMLFMSWQATLAILLVLPLLSYIAFRFNAVIRPIFRAIREQDAVLNTRTQENIAGIHVVKAYVREEHEEQLFRKENTTLLEENLKASYTWSDYVPLMQIVSDLCTPIVLLVGSFLAAQGLMDVGTLVGVTGYIWMLTNPMRMLSNIINMLSRTVTSGEKLFYYMDLGPSIREDSEAQSPPSFKGHVVFDHVSFSYGSKLVLDDISFEALPGQTVAVMGATGTGKSTLVTLLGRFYDIQKGSIIIDGIDVKKHKIKPLRSQIGYVPQETFLFSDSLFENIRFGRPDAPLDRVREAARVGQADEFIERMPQGYETVVGERGVGLSGGQKQRTAIARAVLIDPAILILDDATSAVDMETEYEIQRGLDSVLENRTTFIIAHRISSVKNADLILLLKDGVIAERGNHAELMAKKGIYYGMVMDQMTSAVGPGGEQHG
ncbi:MAG: ABC transporter ATP-binding protein [Clostridiales bacterium]|nr:ABC transporter ATP-binding protein [Clostridiales bacterium]